MIKANIDIPPGVLIFEDPPIHTVHRRLLSRVFTPQEDDRAGTARSVSSALAASTLWSAAGGFDFVADLGAQMPMRASACCSASPRRTRSRQATGRRALRTEAGQPMGGGGAA